jgi:transcriptional regulator with XRE-family HTH domain
MARQTLDRRMLRSWRLGSGLTPELVCVRAKISFPYLHAIEDGSRSPSADVLTRLAGVYGQDVRELFSDHEPAGVR